MIAMLEVSKQLTRTVNQIHRLRSTSFSGSGDDGASVQLRRWCKKNTYNFINAFVILSQAHSFHREQSSSKEESGAISS